MNVTVVDTSTWISYLGGHPNHDLEIELKEGRVFLPPIVVAELLSARLSSSERESLTGLLLDLPLCNASFEHWARVGELRARLSSKGVKVSTPDAHVAQCCLDLQGYLRSEDGIFKKIAKVVTLRML